MKESFRYFLMAFAGSAVFCAFVFGLGYVLHDAMTYQPVLAKEGAGVRCGQAAGFGTEAGGLADAGHRHRQTFPPPPEPALDQVARELAILRERTDQLRWQLEVLLGMWPDRVDLPTPPEGWPAWPAVGDGVGSPMGPGMRDYGKRHPITDADLEKLY